MESLFFYQGFYISFVGGSPPYTVIHLTRLSNRRLFENCTIHNELDIATQQQWRPRLINPTQKLILIKHFCMQANLVKDAKAEVHKTNVPCLKGWYCSCGNFPYTPCQFVSSPSSLVCSAEIAQYYLLLSGFKMQSPVTQTKMGLLYPSSQNMQK